MKKFLTALLLVSTAVSISIISASGQGFHPPCENNLPLQLRTLKEEHPIDSNCDLDGNPANDANSIQNIAKNNFCATGNPIIVTLNTFQRLQRATDNMPGLVAGRRDRLPSDRSVLTDLFQDAQGRRIGEGKVVTYVAFIVNARHSNRSDGESVNCNRGGREPNDIHIELGRTPDEDACRTVTAEISPHFRPETWNDLGFGSFNNFNRPVRIKGQLFFDASHSPCRNVGMANERRASPARVSVWEIHPVYSIDVCRFRTLSRCRANSDTAWTPLHQFIDPSDNP